MYTIRGATTVKNNTEYEINEAVQDLIKKIINYNDLQSESIISFIFSTTEDLNQAYPGKAIRDIGFVDTSIMCLQEMKVESSLKKCIRVMLLVNGFKSKKEINHIYLKDAKNLRKDLNFLSEEK
ncbi:MAG: chorismate mutase [Halanaerobiales bacterium]|nr:chorismate mutase [Halanaerobiales bacterium]